MKAQSIIEMISKEKTEFTYRNGYEPNTVILGEYYYQLLKKEMVDSLTRDTADRKINKINGLEVIVTRDYKTRLLLIRKVENYDY